MTPIVIDASVTAAWLIPDERSPTASATLERVVNQGAHVPALWRLEVANLLLTAQRRGRMTRSQALSVLDELSQLPIQSDPATDDHAWGATILLAIKHTLSAYDAAYLELALRLGADLATFDKQLRRAAVAAGLTVEPASLS